MKQSKLLVVLSSQVPEGMACIVFVLILSLLLHRSCEPSFTIHSYKPSVRSCSISCHPPLPHSPFRVCLPKTTFRQSFPFCVCWHAGRLSIHVSFWVWLWQLRHNQTRYGKQWKLADIHNQRKSNQPEVGLCSRFSCRSPVFSWSPCSW